jgi:replication-associated recombination protein RarA
MKNITFKNYDPQSINDIVFASGKGESLVKDIVSGAFPFPFGGKTGILFYGPPGTGKSALATLLPDAMEMVRTGYPSDFNYFPITPGANGMTVLANIQTQAQFIPFSSHHYFVLDEVDNLTAQAMTILKSVMNTRHSIFVMTTNHLNQIDQAVQDRCHCIPFLAAAAQKWLPLAHRMLANAGISTISDQMLINVIDPCNGSARKIIDALTCMILMTKRNAKGTGIQNTVVV